MPKLNVSVAQFNIVLGDVNKNAVTAERLIVEAARRGSHVVVLPELWSTGYDWDNHRTHAELITGPTFNRMAALAQQHKISIIGSLLERRGDQISNSATFFAANGRMLGVYRKIHLFGLMSEDRFLQAGNAPLMLDLPWGRTALAICYDLRFPELFRRYGVEGTRLVLLPSEWPLARIHHWRTLLQARAIENQCFVVAANAVGTTGDTVFGGHSMVVDPWGQVLLEAGEEPTLLTTEIDMDRTDEVRARIPVFDDRRPEFY